MKLGHFHPFVSLLATAMVDRHCGAKTNHAKKASAVGRLQRAEICRLRVGQRQRPAQVLPDFIRIRVVMAGEELRLPGGEVGQGGIDPVHAGA